jgi:small basic protein
VFFSAKATFVLRKIIEMKKFVVLGAVLGITIFLIVSVSFGKVLYDYHVARRALITESNQRANYYGPELEWCNVFEYNGLD